MKKIVDKSGATPQEVRVFPFVGDIYDENGYGAIDREFIKKSKGVQIMDLKPANPSGQIALNADLLNNFTSDDFIMAGDEVLEVALPINAEKTLKKAGQIIAPKTVARAVHCEAENLPLDRVLNGKIEVELLWENISPNSAFPRQEITLPAGYVNFVVVARLSTAVGRNIPTVWLMSPNRTGQLPLNLGSDGFERWCSVQADHTRILFSDCVKYGTSTPLENSLIIPYQVFGVKGVQ